MDSRDGDQMRHPFRVLREATEDEWRQWVISQGLDPRDTDPRRDALGPFFYEVLPTD